MRECREYVFSQTGGLVHARSRSAIDPSGAKDNHGDRVIADALCAKICHGMSNPKITLADVAKPGTLAFRRGQAQDKKRKEREDW